MPNAFYGIFNENKVILDKGETSHLKIVRLKENDEIKVFDGKGNIYYCIIEKIKKNETICQIKTKETYIKKLTPEIDFYIGASKFDRMKILIEKLVELRVNNIYIFHSKKSQLKFKTIEKFKKTIIESSKQSENPVFPEVGFFDLKDIQTIKNPIVLDLTSTKSLKDELNHMSKVEKISIILGPDMGFTEEEILKLPENRVNLGDTIMRFETAGIYTMSILNYFFDRLY
ncbi:hypothetical protein XO12_01925 [Marinitoga sp. 1154]|uniref:16S rRNA (uracil(1498)-N(3))-methyltransferase n=1 Tax=Marinitoga sp. 1154 TaxID=1643335 RepID=UPI001585D274|nr:RsmE family RNA methyltransferase [Marinitoga sp. 1154]NUU98912.1 hypothetical protein [Marinitoga sp. 1154]